MKETPERTAQSHVIIGAEGSGKTVLLRRIALNLDGRGGLCPCVIDGRKLFSVDDIWKYCPGGSWEGVLEWQKSNERRVVLLIDNVQYLFYRIDSTAQFSLRGKLNNNGAPILVATSNEVLSAFTDYKAAFYDGLKLSYIRPVDGETIQLMGFSDREMTRVNILLGYLPRTIRSLMLIKRVLQISAKMADDVSVLCDLRAPVFQIKYDSLVMQSQRILSVLALSESGMTLQQLREATKQESGILSPYLGKLVTANVLEKVTSTSRNAIYCIKDKLFRCWLTKSCVYVV
jgi:hypothetical protein